MKSLFTVKFAVSAALALTALAPAQAETDDLSAAFDAAFGMQYSAPRDFTPQFTTDLELRIARLADGRDGRIGVYALDLSSGQEINVLSDQWFPMASTSKVAIAAAFLAGVDEGRWSLTSEFRLPRRGNVWLTAQEHLDLMISKSCNDCTDALLAAVGGPTAVNRWMQRAGIDEFQLTRDIRTLVDEDGRLDPAMHIDINDGATPRAMGQLLAGIYQGKWLSPQSRLALLSAMAETTTGKNRMPAGLPQSANLLHKTGTLSRTASDIGIFYTPDGRAIAAAIYVTGQSASMASENGSRRLKLEARRNRDDRIASITGALYRGFSNEDDRRVWLDSNAGG